jgi:putative heme-binding domain-containing protein
MKRLPIFALSGFLLAAPSLFAQRDLKDIPDPSADEEMASFELPEGFEINLFASDPMIAKPVQMNWDADGRLWLVSSRLYPHIEPGQRSDDKILVLEDTNDDGKADKSTEFADGLLIPTGLMPGDGGVYAANSTEMLFLKDTDGDGRADLRRTELSGFGTEDTHHIIHCFRGGPDGMLYFNQSIYIHSHVETPWGVRRLLGGGIWHYRPETRELEVFCKGFVNPWGHVFDRWGQSFGTDGAYGEGINYIFPGSVWATSPDAKRIMTGLNPGQPKQCSLEVLSGRHLPEDWQGSLVTNDFRGHRVNRFVVTESESGYTSRQVEDLIRTNHPAFRPIDVRQGPDGAIYIADWYNPIIQHGEVDFRDPRRDHVHGRIWRITAKGRPLVEKPQIAGAPIATLLENLKAPEDWTRHFSKRELRLHPAEEVTAALDPWVAGIDRREEGSTHSLMEALWAYQSINLLKEDLLRELLASPAHHARAAAVRVVYHWHHRLSDAQAILAKVVADPHPQVRLEAVNALRQLGTAEAAQTALRALDLPVDKNLDFALWLTARELQGAWLPAFQAGKIDFSQNAAHLTFAMTASENPAALKPLVAAVREKRIPAKDLGAVLPLIASLGDAEDLGMLVDYALDGGNSSSDQRANVMKELARAKRARSVVPSGDLARVKALLGADAAENLRAEAARAIAEWKLDWARPMLVEWVGKATLSPVLTQAAVDGLAAFGGGDNLEVLRVVARDAKRSTLARSMSVVGIAAMDLNAAASEATALFGNATTRDGFDGVFAAFLTRKEGPGVLAATLKDQSLPAEVATLGVQRAGAAGRDTGDLVAVLTKAGGLEPITQQLTPEQMTAMMETVKTAGDPARGEAVFRRAALLCMTCHGIGGSGGVIGPDLVSIGSSAPVDYIIESLLEPAKKIKEGYHMTVVTRKDGSVVAGTVLREDEKEIVVRDAAGIENRMPKSDFAKKEILPVSMMPAGLTATLRKDEFIDLVRFLSELGKEGPYKVGSERKVRTWQVVDYNDGLSDAIRRQGLTASIIADPAWPWRPLYSQVNGDLPLGEFGENIGFNNSKLALARFQIEVTGDGEIGLKVANPEGVQIRFGDAMVDMEKGSLHLGPGKHTGVAIIDRGVRDGGFSLELVDVIGSAAKASAVGGR